MAAELYAVVGAGIVAAALAVVLRQIRPEYALLVSLAAGVFIVYKVFGEIVPVVSEVGRILEAGALPSRFGDILFKSLGICLLAQIGCDACRDAGESAIASKIELAARICVLGVSLPLFTQVLNVVNSLLV
jgi:stage III sporulation protein AD